MSAGRPRTGLYPQLSRTAVAKKAGVDVSTITSILNGRIECSLRVAGTIARMAGVSLRQLHEDLLGVRAARGKR